MAAWVDVTGRPVPDGTPSRGRPRTYDHDMIAALADLGLTHRQIAESLGCHVETVRYALKRRGA